MTLADLARRLNHQARRRVPASTGGAGWRPGLALLTDEDRGPDPLAAARRLPVGAVVILRSYGLAVADRARLADRLAAVCRARRLVLLVAADAGLAAATRADGLHLPEGLARHGRLAPLLAWRRRRGGLLTVATHGPGALRRAARLGADAALLSPVFPTASHPGGRTLGPVRLARWTRTARLPVLALGGVRPIPGRRLSGTGVCGLATVGGL